MEPVQNPRTCTPVPTKSAVGVCVNPWSAPSFYILFKACCLQQLESHLFYSLYIPPCLNILTFGRKSDSKDLISPSKALNSLSCQRPGLENVLSIKAASIRKRLGGALEKTVFCSTQGKDESRHLKAQYSRFWLNI